MSSEYFLDGIIRGFNDFYIINLFYVISQGINLYKFTSKYGDTGFFEVNLFIFNIRKDNVLAFII